MANQIKIKRSAVEGKVPLVTDLELGELAINTYDGKLFVRRNDGVSDYIREIGGVKDGAGINIAADGTISADVTSVAGRTGAITLTKSDVGLGNVDNTADSVKSVASAAKLTTARTISITGDATGSASFDGSANASILVTVEDDSHNHVVANIDGLQTTLDSKVDKVAGKGLSTEDYTTAEKTKLAGIEAGAQVNTVTSVAGRTGAVTLSASDVSGLATVATSGSYNDLTDKPTGYTLQPATATVLGGVKDGAGVTIAADGTLSADVTSVAGRTGAVVLTKSDVGLANVDNTADSAKSVASAATITTGRTIGMTGDVTWTSASFNGSANVTGTATLANSGVTAGTYPKVTVDAKGRVTAGASLAAADIPNLDASKITSGTIDAARIPTGISITGNAATATALQTARTINGVSFDGTANITVADSTKIPTTEKGAANGVATLDGTGKVPSTQLPSYVDDVLEYTNLASFPVTGETGKIYVALDTNKAYRWSGSAYVYITSGAVDSVAGKTGVVTLVKADVGLANVDNTADSAKSVASAAKLTTARTINGVSFDGTANITVADSTKLPLAGGTMTGAITFAAGQTWPTFNQNTTGSAATLTTGRTIGMTGDVTWTSASFNGSANVTGTATLANSGVTAGTYPKVTVDAKGRVTAGASLAAADIPSLDASKITSGTIDAARLPAIAASSVTTANWTFGQDTDGSLVFKYNGVAKARLGTDGTFLAINVDSDPTP